MASTAGTVQQLLRERAEDDSTAILHDGRSQTWREHISESSQVAAALIGIAVAAILGGLFFLLNVDDAVDTDDPPIEETDIDTTAPEAVDGDGTPAGEDG